MQKKRRKIKMKKILISLFLLFVFTVAVYADLESDKKQILSLFKKYQLSSSNDTFTCTIDIYYVWDYNEKKLQLTLMHSKFKGTNDVFLDLGAYGGNLSPVMASCPISQKRYPVREFINGIVYG